MNVIDDIISAYTPKPEDIRYIVNQNTKLLHDNDFLRKQLACHKNVITNGTIGITILIYGGIFYYFL